MLRNESGEDLAELCEWWTRFQQVSPDERNSMCKAKGGPRKKRSRSRNKKPESE
ncbi:MAG: hypothetical protein OEY00_07810 [Gammaproteobacteria bacterium]|nr:hypothetical protein [Gammaproteobacteria bacterium]